MSISKIKQSVFNSGNLGSNKTAGLNYRTKFLRADSPNSVIPSDWLTLSTPSEPQAIYGLFAVFNNDSNFVAFTVSGAYTVDWGDGTVENFSSGATAQRNFVWSNVSSSTLTSDGFRQVIIKITPQSGQSISSANFNVRHTSYNASGNTNSPTTPWLNMIVKGDSSLTSLTISSSAPNVNFRKLVMFTLLSSAITSTSYMFNNCNALESIPSFNTGNITNTSGMFFNCYSLQSVFLFNTSNVTTMSSMFSSCYLLQSVPLFNTASVNNMDNMFSNCYSLQSVPQFNTINVTSMAGTFAGCYSLQSVPEFNTANVTTMSGMFSVCYSLQSVPLFNTSNVTIMSSMFSSCYSLISVPLFTTASVTAMDSMFNGCNSLKYVPLFNTANVTMMNSMFQNCRSLISVPEFNTANVTTMSGMFNGCTSLSYVPLFNTTKVTTMASMFSSCSSLEVLPAFDGTLLTTVGVGAMLNSCISLQSMNMNFPVGIGLANCKLSSTELNRIYTALPSRLSTSASSASGDGTTVTYTTTTNHGYIPGMVVTVTGFTPSGYNLTSVKIKTVPTSNTFTLSSTTTGTSSGTGTVTCASLSITVTANWGAATDTTTIATNKGWTVIG